MRLAQSLCTSPLRSLAHPGLQFQTMKVLRQVQNLNCTDLLGWLEMALGPQALGRRERPKQWATRNVYTYRSNHLQGLAIAVYSCMLAKAADASLSNGDRPLCIYEEELRELLTYQCPITGRKRCPPFGKENDAKKACRNLC